MSILAFKAILAFKDRLRRSVDPCSVSLSVLNPKEWLDDSALLGQVLRDGKSISKGREDATQRNHHYLSKHIATTSKVRVI